jgi:hypothetical protein
MSYRKGEDTPARKRRPAAVQRAVIEEREEPFLAADLGELEILSGGVVSGTVVSSGGRVRRGAMRRAALPILSPGAWRRGSGVHSLIRFADEADILRQPVKGKREKQRTGCVSHSSATD